MGYNAISVKVDQVKRAINDGVDNVEMVVSFAAMKDVQWSYVYNDINRVYTAARLKTKKYVLYLR